MKRLTFIITVFVCCTYAPALWAGSTTLVTYYPAPSGHYDTLQLTPGLDETKACGPNSDGVIFIDKDGEIKSCSGSKVAGGNTSWKLSESPSAPGTTMLVTPSSASTVYITQRVGVGIDPNKSVSNDKLVVGGGIAVTPPEGINKDPNPTMPYSSRIVFYLNQIPKLYAGVTQTLTDVLSFMGPGENAENSFLTINNTSGNIGIGKNNPAAKLDIVGDIKTSGNILSDSQIISGGGFYLTSSPATSTAGEPSITSGADKSIILSGGGNAGSKTVKINDYLEVAGNVSIKGSSVGIGLAAAQDPKSTLEVNGKIYAQTPDVSDGDNAVVTKGYLSANATACFNRFCSYSVTAGSTGDCSTPLVCPANYPQVSSVRDDFVTDNFTKNSTAMEAHVVSIACCSSGTP